MRRKFSLPILVLTLLVAFGGLATAAGPYPLITPDFSHVDEPHKLSGSSVPLTWQLENHRLLVIYGTFTDTTAQNRTESQIEAMFFPEDTFGTLVNYFKVASSHGFEFVPAPERGGAVGNGVVVINLGPFAPFNSMTPQQRRRTLLDRADAVVDFDQFDVNVDNLLTGDELAVVTMYTDVTYTCGQTASVAAGEPLDGKTVAFATVEGGHMMNVLTFAHELGHQHMGMTDFYGYGAGSYDIAGPTCSNPNRFQLPNAWHRMHWGWVGATTVTRDGYYALGDVAHEPENPIVGSSYLLYDPERGEQEYFLIENRQSQPGYDQSVVDSGVIIWRVDERNLDSPREDIRPIEIIRPDGRRNPGCLDQDVDGRIDEEAGNGVDDDGDGRIDEDLGDDDGDGSKDEDPVNTNDDDGDGQTDEDGPDPAFCYSGNAGDAWPSDDPVVALRTMVGQWGDGTPAKLAVRAIEASGNTMWVYIDVRGPGVLVDPADSLGHRFQLDAPAGQPTEVAFPVMNTGEATDTFDFSVLVPSGWTASTQTMTLAAGQSATSRITVTPPATAPLGTVIVQASGQSTSDSSVRTVAHFNFVVQRPTSVQYTGDATAEYSDPATVSVLVTDGLSGQPLAGRSVTFDLGTQTAAAETDANGIATASIVVDQEPGTVEVSAVVTRTDTHGRAEFVQNFAIDEEDLALELTNPLLQPLGEATVVTIQATEADTSPGDLTRALVQVSLQPSLTTTPQSGQATLDGTGAASLPFGVLPSDLWSIGVTLVSDYFEAPALTTELVIFDAGARISGFASGMDQTGQRVKLTAAVSYSSNDAIGTLEMQSKPNKFDTTDVDWVVVAGNRALVQAAGTFNGAPAVLRADVQDGGLGNGTNDRFSLRITSPSGELLYQSGDVLRENGNLILSRAE